jgi:Ni/Co efflux regulator RcnB
MNHYLKVLALSAALIIPVAVSAQSRDQQDRRQTNQQIRRYQDKAHNDSHQWDDREDQTYRRYLQEQRKDYRDFSRVGKRGQNNYWNWRHIHGVDDRH